MQIARKVLSTVKNKYGFCMEPRFIAGQENVAVAFAPLGGVPAVYIHYEFIHIIVIEVRLKWYVREFMLWLMLYRHFAAHHVKIGGCIDLCPCYKFAMLAWRASERSAEMVEEVYRALPGTIGCELKAAMEHLVTVAKKVVQGFAMIFVSEFFL